MGEFGDDGFIFAVNFGVSAMWFGWFSLKLVKLGAF